MQKAERCNPAHSEPGRLEIVVGSGVIGPWRAHHRGGLTGLLVALAYLS